MIDDLVAWLRQQLDEDERGIQDLTRPVTEPLLSSRRDVHEWVLQAPPKRGITRIRLEAEAKRQILDEYEKAIDRRARHRDDMASAGALLALLRVVKLLALPYSDRPGYREEWKP